MNQVDQLNGAALAYIGDAIYEVYVRQHVIASGLTQPNRLHRAATRYVEAKGQAYAMQCLRDQEALNEEELTIYKRGRNHKANTKAKNARQQALKPYLAGFISPDKVSVWRS